MLKSKIAILIVDDNHLVRQMLSVLLRSFDYDVQSAIGADEAICAFQQGKRFDLVISDMVMPGTHGLELVHTLRTMQPGIPAILISGLSPDDLGLTEKDTAECSFLSKPFSAHVLHARIEQLLHAGQENSQ